MGWSALMARKASAGRPSPSWGLGGRRLGRMMIVFARSGDAQVEHTLSDHLSGNGGDRPLNRPSM